MTLPRDPTDDLDRLMDDDAGELGALYRRLPRVDPPKRLDRTVLGDAARAVRGRRPRHHGWIVGFGSAAGVVLAAGIAWQIGRNVAQQSSPEAYRSSTSVVPVQPITDSTSRRRESVKETRDSSANRTPAAANPAQDVASPQPTRKPEARKAAPTAPKAPAPAAPMNAAAPPPAAVAPQAPNPFPVDDQEKKQDSTDRMQTPTTAGRAAANAGGAMPERAQDAGASGMLGKDKSERTRSVAAPAPSGSVELRRDMQLSPNDWIAHIQELVRQGRRQQALESLRLLRRMHPEAEIPAKLRALEN